MRDGPGSRASGWLLSCVALITVFLVARADAALERAALTPREIVDRVDRLLRGDSSRGEVEMEVSTRHWKRTLRMTVWSLGTKDALVRVTAPAREAGTATLKVGSEVWNYLPRVDRTIKVPPSLMMGSWMGSHLTNDDLVKESRMVDDYAIALSFDGDRGDVKVWEFTLTPKPEAAVVWGRVVEQVRQSDLMPQWARYYDEGGALVRTITFSDFQGPELTPSAPYAVILPSCTQEDLDEVRIITGPARVRGSGGSTTLCRSVDAGHRGGSAPCG